MGAKDQKKSEFRMIEIPGGEDITALLGCEQIRDYGYSAEGIPGNHMHFHNAMEVGICRWGSGTIWIAERKYAYESGSIVVIPQNVPHYIVTAPEEKSFWEFLYFQPMSFLRERFQVDKQEGNRLQGLIEKRPFVTDITENALLTQEINLLMNQLRLKEYNYVPCCRGVLYTLLMELVKINHNFADQDQLSSEISIEKVGKLEKALDFIDEHYMESIHVGDVAKSVYISESHLRQLFLDYFETSPGQYINQVRIEKACRMIMETDKTVCEIGYLVGYENTSTYLKNFKKVTGMTPKNWRIVNKPKTEYRRRN